MQMLWWDQAVTSCAVDIFAEYPECVRIQTLINYRLLRLSDDLECLKPGLMFYTKYGLTDTGLYDMSKWRAHGMRFGDREQAHAREYLQQGFRVFWDFLPHSCANSLARGSAQWKDHRPGDRVAPGIHTPATLSRRDSSCHGIRRSGLV